METVQPWLWYSSLNINIFFYWIKIYITLKSLCFVVIFPSSSEASSLNSKGDCVAKYIFYKNLLNVHGWCDRFVGKTVVIWICFYLNGNTQQSRCKIKTAQSQRATTTQLLSQLFYKDNILIVRFAMTTKNTKICEVSQLQVPPVNIFLV